MFKNLMNFSYKRTGIEAFGFYLAYLAVILLIGFIVGGLFAVISGVETVEEGRAVAKNVTWLAILMSVVYCSALSIAVTRAKRFRGFGAIFGILLTVALSLFGGILGLIIVSYQTTKDVDLGTGQYTIEN